MIISRVLTICCRMRGSNSARVGSHPGLISARDPTLELRANPKSSSSSCSTAAPSARLWLRHSVCVSVIKVLLLFQVRFALRRCGRWGCSQEGLSGMSTSEISCWQLQGANSLFSPHQQLDAFHSAKYISGWELSPEVGAARIWEVGEQRK